MGNLSVSGAVLVRAADTQERSFKRLRSGAPVVVRVGEARASEMEVPEVRLCLLINSPARFKDRLWPQDSSRRVRRSSAFEIPRSSESRRPSQPVTAFMARRALLVSFAAIPALPEPKRAMCRPKALRTGLHRSKTTLDPPTITVRVPFLAPSGPPEMGESRNASPAALAAEWQSREKAKPTVEVSMRTPLRPDDAMRGTSPVGERRTSQPIFSDGRDTRTTSQSFAISDVVADLIVAVGPAALMTALTFNALTSLMTTSYPALQRFITIPYPMFPTPTNPTTGFAGTAGR
mmetsp:Transcript_23771/g.49459  ORF Transcript_23771/g.49459 Transcript_23771/m.49459 type:complete len:291 (+) Transcript_23771:201-1073(+)